MKTYLKTLLRMFEKHVTRFISLIFIVLVSVGFVAGVGSATDKITYSLNDYYKAQNVSDFIIKSTADGFSDEEIEKIENRYGKENVETGMSVDVYLPVHEKTQLVRLYFFDGDDKKINAFESVTSGSVSGEHLVKAERSDNKIKGLSLGDEITLDFKDILKQLAEQDGKTLDDALLNMLSALEPVTVTVGEIVASPLAFAQDGEASYLNDEGVLNDMPDTIDAVNALITLENILYLSSDIIPCYRDMVNEFMAGFMSEELLNTRLLGVGDIYVKTADRALFRTYSKQYKAYIDTEKTEITDLLGEDLRVITLYDNYSFRGLKSYSDKVTAIGYALMVAFLFVTALVAFSSMTRLLEEERSQIACLQTIGYSGIRIIFKYLLFAMIATGIGGVGAYFVADGIGRLLYFVFNYSFAMPPMSLHMPMLFFLLTYFFVVIMTLGATFISGEKLVNTKPAELLRPKAPKAGKKVFLERIPLIWNRLSFTYKSTVRNVLRYRYRFLMTVIAVAVSTALIMAGLALLDVCLFGGLDSPSIMSVALVVVIFAGLLTAVVIYTLTNINISERNRELATLMVLGYYDGEVSAYVYREIYIDTVVGIILGYPLAVALMAVLFKIMVVGSIAGVSWFMWLLTPVIVLLFTFVVTMILRRKIVKIDMNESLKAVE